MSAISRSEGLSVTMIAAAALLAALVAMLVVWGAKPAEAAFPGANGKIAFASDRDGDYEIFAMNPDGTWIEQLTFNTANSSNTAHDSIPAWSANGSWIAWNSRLDGNSEIYMRTYGGNLNFAVRLTINTANDESPAFSPDGSKIAFSSNRDGNGEIYVMDTSDTNGDGNADNQTNITKNAAGDFEPDWSPDGTKIAFYSSRGDGDAEIWVMDADGTDPVKLTNNLTATDTGANWSPDGSKIAFSSNRDGNFNIYVMKADGSSQKRLTNKAPDDYRPAWSPNGKRITFTTTRGGSDTEIYVMKPRPEGRKNRPKNLTKNDAADFGSDWQPIPQP